MLQPFIIFINPASLITPMKKKVKKAIAKVKHKSHKPKVSKKSENTESHKKKSSDLQPVATRELPPQPEKEVFHEFKEPEPEEKKEPEKEEPEQEETESEEVKPETKEHTILIGEAIEFGWNSVKQHAGFFIGVFLLFFALSFMMYGAGALGTRIVLGLLVSGMSLGYRKLAIDMVDGKPPEFKELFSCFSLLLKYLLAAILYSIIVAAGLVFFVIPGIIWAVQFGFYSFVIVKERSWPWSALKKSSALTSGVRGKLIIFAFALLGINLLGVVALGIGIIITIPLSVIAAAHVFNQLEENA